MSSSRLPPFGAIALVAAGLAAVSTSWAANPIVIRQGLTSPKVRVYNDRAYLYGSHDASPKSKGFKLNDWWVWASDDLVSWSCESILKPEQTYWGKPYDQCWATTYAGLRDGKYYWYFSRGNAEIGVVVGDSPVGPWKDTLGKALVTKAMIPQAPRDPALLQENDGTAYLAFGVWDYYIAKLNPDMISFAEKPRLLELDQKMGPYGPGKLDDKPNLHKFNGKYYLSWGCYYAMSDGVSGPYIYKGCIIEKDRTAPAFHRGLTFDRQGSFFEFHGQWYFACNDQSWPGSGQYFRNAVIGYLHYRANGEIEPIYLDETGVGQYDAKRRIEAENYFDAHGLTKHESPDGGFEIRDVRDGSWLRFPNVDPLPANATISVRAASGLAEGGTIEVRNGGVDGHLLGTCQISGTNGWDAYVDVSAKLENQPGKTDLYLVFRGTAGELLRLNWVKFD